MNAFLCDISEYLIGIQSRLFLWHIEWPNLFNHFSYDIREMQMMIALSEQETFNRLAEWTRQRTVIQYGCKWDCIFLQNTQKDSTDMCKIFKQKIIPLLPTTTCIVEHPGQISLIQAPDVTQEQLKWI